MVVERNGKYRKSFQSMIRQIMGADSDARLDSSLDGDISIVYDDDGGDGGDAGGSTSTDESESGRVGNDGSLGGKDSELSKIVGGLLPGRSLTISGGRVSVDAEGAAAEHANMGEPPKERRQALFYTAEQLGMLQVEVLRGSGAPAILNPGAKLKKKRPAKRCANFDD